MWLVSDVMWFLLIIGLIPLSVGWLVDGCGMVCGIIGGWVFHG